MTLAPQINRVRFLLRDYLRTRLWKIEKYVFHVLASDVEMARLSTAEIKYARQYRALLEAHLSKSLLAQLPDKFRRVDADSAQEKVVQRPSMDHHVFCVAAEPVGRLELDEEETAEMEAGDIYILRYGAVAQLVKDGRVSLL